MISGFSFWALYPITITRKSRKFIKNPNILKYENVISRTLEILFKWHCCQNNSATLLIVCHIVAFQENLTPLDLLNWVCFFVCLFVCFSFNAQKVEIVIETQIHIHLNFIDPKINIFRDFRVFVLSPIPKNKNSEITEILQKCHNTEIWECSLESSCSSNHKNLNTIQSYFQSGTTYLSFKSF